MGIFSSSLLQTKTTCEIFLSVPLGFRTPWGLSEKKRKKEKDHSVYLLMDWTSKGILVFFPNPPAFLVLFTDYQIAASCNLFKFIIAVSGRDRVACASPSYYRGQNFQKLKNTK